MRMKRMLLWSAAIVLGVAIQVRPSFPFLVPNEDAVHQACKFSISLCANKQPSTADDRSTLPGRSNEMQTIQAVKNRNDVQQDEEMGMLLTSAILRVSYDGSRFTGWSAANDATNSQLLVPSRRRRRRGALGEIPPNHLVTPFVRSVEVVLKENLAKIYGNVDPESRIVVEGCSRTDRGVHATGMIAHIYCLKKTAVELDEMLSDSCNSSRVTIPGKRKPHPASPTDDSFFEPVPMNGSLSRLAGALNRMRPYDVKVTGIAPTPLRDSRGDVFHASLSSLGKTYEYRISTGYLYDPTLRGTVWHVGHSDLDLNKMEDACRLFQGTHNFAAFQGAPRGSEDKRRRAEQQKEQEQHQEQVGGTKNSGSTCTIKSIQVLEVSPSIHDDIYFTSVDPPLRTFKIVVQGDRFLYKMVRFLVGSLVAVGYDKLDLEDIQRALETCSWEILNDPSGCRRQFECAPPHGLILKEVDYGGVSFDWQPLREASN